MENKKSYKDIYQVLRIAVAMCFIGHGAFGIITKPIWCNYFAVAGIDKATAYQLMPLVGTVDIMMGMVMLVYPIRAVAAWLVGWGLLTASMRPLSGEPVAELIERAGNFGAPLALLILCGIPANLRNWFRKMDQHPQPDTHAQHQLMKCLKVVVFLLITGHGWLNLIEKKSLLQQYTAMGFANPATIAHSIGMLEIAAAIMVLVKPLRGLLLALAIWKMGSELFYPHYEIFEWIERGGSYGAILALWRLTGKPLFINNGVGYPKPALAYSERQAL